MKNAQFWAFIDLLYRQTCKHRNHMEQSMESKISSIDWQTDNKISWGSFNDEHKLTNNTLKGNDDGEVGIFDWLMKNPWVV